MERGCYLEIDYSLGLQERATKRETGIRGESGLIHAEMMK